MTEPTHGEEPTRWAELNTVSAASYAARFDQLQASGVDVHGEASFIRSLVSPPARVLDAGCGTGRVAIRLAQLGYQCFGVDADQAMVQQAIDRSSSDDGPGWAFGDLSEPARWRPAPGSELPDWLDGGVAVTVAAGNVIPLLAPGTLHAVVAGLADRLADNAFLVSGFGLDAAHLPKRCPVTELAGYDAACSAAGLILTARYRTWSGEPWQDAANGSDAPARGGPGGYAVSVHQKLPGHSAQHR
jgi:SAM-dependent methyltransferase